jgi:hypothetical protein
VRTGDFGHRGVALHTAASVHYGTATGNINGADVRLTGALADLSPIRTVPGMRAEYLTSLLPTGSIPAQITQNLTNVLDKAADTSPVANVLLKTVVFAPSVTLCLTATGGAADRTRPRHAGGARQRGERPRGRYHGVRRRGSRRCRSRSKSRANPRSSTCR